MKLTRQQKSTALRLIRERGEEWYKKNHIEIYNKIKKYL